MFTFPAPTDKPAITAITTSSSSPQISKYKNAMYPQSTPSHSNEMNYNMIDALLETEKLRNKTEAWNKLDKTQKTLNLHAFAEKYGKDHGLPMKEIKNLKSFFNDCLDKSKLQKTKDVIYNKETREITSIPSLYFNATGRAFSLKSIDTKRVSTLKSLTPKRGIENQQATATENASIDV
jgi:hypothetical protein